MNPTNYKVETASVTRIFHDFDSAWDYLEKKVLPTGKGFTFSPGQYETVNGRTEWVVA